METLMQDLLPLLSDGDTERLVRGLREHDQRVAQLRSEERGLRQRLEAAALRPQSSLPCWRWAATLVLLGTPWMGLVAMSLWKSAKPTAIRIEAAANVFERGQCNASDTPIDVLLEAERAQLLRAAANARLDERRCHVDLQALQLQALARGRTSTTTTTTRATRPSGNMHLTFHTASQQRTNMELEDELTAMREKADACESCLRELGLEGRC
mmetsp:Transcript_68089/g.158006  ORF Transcript_68089/g.158006 Transcript_68089/m.158006 type:complete len:212 (+) Transcript_68089:54-689(+)